ncbi:MAG: hypothetical protein AAF170_11285 [Bacteroidota bacterium]
MSDRQPDAPQPISRRESLKRAAGALALGLGAPMSALAAESEDERKSVLAFYRAGSRDFAFDGKGNDLVHKMEIPEEVAEMLMRPEAFGYIKLGDIEGRRGAVFQVIKDRR